MIIVRYPPKKNLTAFVPLFIKFLLPTQTTRPIHVSGSRYAPLCKSTRELTDKREKDSINSSMAMEFVSLYFDDDPFYCLPF